MLENLYSLAFQIIVFFILALIINAFVNWRVKRVSQIIDYQTNAQYILKIGLLLSLALVISEIGDVVSPLKNSLRITSKGDSFYIELAQYLTVFATIGLILLVVNYFISILAFNLLSGGKNLFIEMCNDNWILMLLFLGLFVSISIFIKAEMVAILDYLIPYPSIRGFN